MSLTFATTIEPSAPAFGRDMPHRRLDGAAHDLHPDEPITVTARASSATACAQQGDSAAGDDAPFDRRLRGVHRVLDARLLLLHLGLGGGADLDDGYATDQLRQPLLQLLAVVVRGACGSSSAAGHQRAWRPSLTDK